MGETHNKVIVDISARGAEEVEAKINELEDSLEKARSLADDLARAMKDMKIDTKAIQESNVIALINRTHEEGDNHVS